MGGFPNIPGVPGYTPQKKRTTYRNSIKDARPGFRGAAVGRPGIESLVVQVEEVAAKRAYCGA